MGVVLRGGEEPTTAGGGNFVGLNLKRNKRAPQWGAVPIEVAEDRKVPWFISSLLALQASEAQQ